MDEEVKTYVKGHLKVVIPSYLLMVLLEIFVLTGTASDFMLVVQPVAFAINMLWFWPTYDEEEGEEENEQKLQELS